MKLNTAKQYYNEGKYEKAIPLMEELMSVLKGTQDVEELFYFYPYCHFGSGSYLLASYYFKRFVENYPKTMRAQEARFMAAYCLYKMSPEPSLEQDYTQKAIEAFQLFANAYPKSDKVAECNKLIDRLRQKMETKAINAAQLYYDMKDFRAAAAAFNNVLLDYPETNKKELIMYQIIDSYYLLAENSIRKKQEERYQKCIDAFRVYKSRHPNGKYIKIAERRSTDAADAIEMLYFNEVKHNFDDGNRAFRTDKEEKLNEAIKAYYLFIDKFPSSTLLRDAERIYEQSNDQLEKINKKKNKA